MFKVLPDNDRYEDMNGGAPPVPEKTLQAAALRRAFWDLSVWPYETLEWFEDREHHTPFSFASICLSLDLDEEQLRNAAKKHVAELDAPEELKRLRSRFSVVGSAPSKRRKGSDLQHQRYLGFRLGAANAVGRAPAADPHPELPGSTASKPQLHPHQTPEVVVSIKGFGELLATGQVAVEEYLPPVRVAGERKPEPEPVARVRIHPWLG